HRLEQVPGFYTRHPPPGELAHGRLVAPSTLGHLLGRQSRRGGRGEQVTVLGHHAGTGCRYVRAALVQLAEPLPDHLPGQEGVPLSGQAETQPLDVCLGVGAVPGGGTVRADQTLVLQEPDLGDAHRRELPLQDAQRRPDGHRRGPGHTERPAAAVLPGPGGLPARCGCSGRAHCSAEGAGAAASSPRRGLGWKVSRNLPICTSSPACNVPSSIRERFTYVPFRLPTSRTVNWPASPVNSACLRETVTSSRKMSAAGSRPAVTRGASSRNRAPAFGPCWTISSAECGGSASTAARSLGSIAPGGSSS